MLAACGNASNGGRRGHRTVADYPSTPRWKWVFVNHLTASIFFQATKQGIADATSVTHCTFEWTGSSSLHVAEMVSAMDAAISDGADGIAVSLVDAKAFNDPTSRALDKGIPVVSYNADAAGNGRLAHIGHDPFLSGQEMGERIVQMVPSGKVALFTATPDSRSTKPRIDGALQAISASRAPIKVTAIETATRASAAQATIDAYYQANADVKGMFAVDAVSTQGIGEVMQKYSLPGKVHGGGFDLLPTTVQLIKAGILDFAIDLLPYFQGFLPAMSLYLYKLSGSLLTPADTNTGLKFVTENTVDPYLAAPNRYASI